VGAFVVLLRGINVGGHNKLPMADLRAALSSDGLTDVQTYIQSGNVVLTASTPDADVVGAQVRSVIARDFGLDIPAIALSAEDLAGIVVANPYPDEVDPKRVHAIVLPHAPGPGDMDAIDSRQAAASGKGSRDAVAVIGRTAYLHTPDGFGTSELARTLTSGARGPLKDGTARNWSTITTLLGMCR